MVTGVDDRFNPQITQITQRRGATTKLGYSQYHIAVACGFSGVTGVGCGPTRYRDVVLTVSKLVKRNVAKKTRLYWFATQISLKEPKASTH
jgi:hypothetical protein